MENKKALTAMDVYINKAYKLVLLLVPLTCLMAGMVWLIHRN